MEELALKLRHLAVREWLENSEEYQGFLSHDGADGSELPLVLCEAPKFLQPGYFHGPLASTMVTAVTNALTIPVIVFSSALHHPIIYITPRRCTASTPLYAAFNQHGAGHYDAVTYSELPVSTLHDAPSQSSSGSYCRCGVNDKKAKEHCTKIEGKYTTSIRYPCLKADQPCTSSCQCKGCANPCGTEMVSANAHHSRSRRKHVWQSLPEKKFTIC